MYIECKLLSVGKYISQWLCLPDIFLFYNMRPHGHGTKKICPALTPELAWFYIAGWNINTIQHGALEQFHRRTFCPGHLLQLFKLFLETCKIVVRHFNMTCFLTGRNLVGWRLLWIFCHISRFWFHWHIWLCMDIRTKTLCALRTILLSLVTRYSYSIILFSGRLIDVRESERSWAGGWGRGGREIHSRSCRLFCSSNNGVFRYCKAYRRVIRWKTKL